MTRWRLAGVLSTIILTTTSTSTQSARPEPLERIGFLLGRWEGKAVGQPGEGTVSREYSRALNDRFIRARHRGEYPPQQKNPKGEVHEDEAFFSFDKARKRIVLRQFHAEGFVNTYVEDADSTPSKLVFTTEAIENIPTGFRARETYLVHGPDEFEEVFEISEPMKPFEVYSRTRLKRVK